MSTMTSPAGALKCSVLAAAPEKGLMNVTYSALTSCPRRAAGLRELQRWSTFLFPFPKLSGRSIDSSTADKRTIEELEEEGGACNEITLQISRSQVMDFKYIGTVLTGSKLLSILRFRFWSAKRHINSRVLFYPYTKVYFSKA